VSNRWWRTLWARLIGRAAQEGLGVASGAVPIRPAILDRGPAINADGGALRSRMSNLLGIALLALLCAGFMSWYYSHAAGRRNAGALRRAPVPVKADFVLPPLQVPKPQVPAAPSATSALVTDTAYAVGNVLDGLTGPASGSALMSLHSGLGDSPVLAQNQQPGGGMNKSPWELARERRLDGALWIHASEPSRSLAASDVTTNSSQVTNLPTAAGEAGRAPAGAHALSDMLHPAVIVAAHADVLPTQRLLLPKGAFIDCTLETAIDSTLPGLTTCITPVDTYSADGTVVLLERGTKLIGEIRGDVQQGSSRVFVLWTEARTPLGVIVPLASPGTDELGRSGLPGDANHHFFERFGAAILVSVIDGAMQAAANAHSSGSSGSTIVMNPSGTQDVLTEVLRSTISIPPTVTKPQGDRIQILVARDLDFRSVYQLHLH
jgi:type IV secretion system protein VirB10